MLQARSRCRVCSRNTTAKLGFELFYSIRVPAGVENVILGLAEAISDAVAAGGHDASIRSIGRVAEPCMRNEVTTRHHINGRGYIAW